MSPAGRWGLLASTDYCHLQLLYRSDFSHLLLLLCLPGCCDHPIPVHAVPSHQSLHANLHRAGETSWWVCPNALHCQSSLDRNLLAQHVQPQLTWILPGNDLEIQLLRGKVKWYLANYGPFHFDCCGGGWRGGECHGNLYRKKSKNGLI